MCLHAGQIYYARLFLLASRDLKMEMLHGDTNSSIILTQKQKSCHIYNQLFQFCLNFLTHHFDYNIFFSSKFIVLCQKQTI